MKKVNTNSNITKFDKVINDFKELKLKPNSESKLRINKLTNFAALTNDFKRLRGKVYPIRLKEIEELFEEHAHKIKFSSFELMQHNFRENSHSNVLRYIFHHRFWEEGKVVLSKFIENITNDNELSKLVLKSNYEIHREFSVKDGRIDLLIEDEQNKFVIVIENKINASIAIKERKEDNSVSKTQLDNYLKFISSSSKYIGYKKCFILLSLYPEKDIQLGKFEQKEYKELLEIIETIETKNNIVNDYKILLHSIINNQDDKEWLLEFDTKLKTKKEKFQLNTFEIAKIYFQ